MDHSIWNDTNQHWLPRFILRGFGQRGRSSIVFELDCETGCIEPRDVADAASKVRLLSERDDELLHSIENRASNVVGKIRKRQNINETERRSLDDLVWAMMVNDPYYGIDRAATRESVIAAAAEEFGEAFEEQGAILEPNIISEIAEQALNHDYLNIGAANENRASIQVLRFMGLSVYEPPEGEYFVIGDSPILVIRGSGSSGRSLLNPGSQVILPIQHSRLLVYDWSTRVNHVRYAEPIDLEPLRSLDDDYRHRSTCRYLYGRNERSLLRSSELSPQLDSKVRSTLVADGWSIMQTQQRGLDREAEAINAQHRDTRRSVAKQIVKKAKQEAQQQHVDD